MREQRDSLTREVNKRRERGSKLSENCQEKGAKIPPRPFLDVYFIRNGRCAGCTAPLVHSYRLCGLFKDKTVMYLDWNNSKKSQAHQCFNSSSLSCSFVSQHKFAPVSPSCWLCSFLGRQWRKISLYRCAEGVESAVGPLLPTA